MNAASPERFVFRHHPLLGTVVEVIVSNSDEAEARSLDAAVVAEIERLEDVFSAFRTDSELNRWKRDELDAPPSVDLSRVMAAALDWQDRSGGVFNPLAGQLSQVWADAEAAGTMPAAHALRDAADAIGEPRYEMVDGVPTLRGDCTDLNLNAIAKGYIVDSAAHVAHAMAADVAVLVSAGGDMRHLGRAAAIVGIANPLRPYDNEPPVTSIALYNAGLATSGGSRRGFRFGEQRVSHELDARTGLPLRTHASISVVAPDAMTADALTTVTGALSPVDTVATIEARPDAACLVIDTDGRHHADRAWGRLAVT